MTNELEDRLRSDLPQLADHVLADGAEPIEANDAAASRWAPVGWAVACAAIVVALVAGAVVLEERGDQVVDVAGGGETDQADRPDGLSEEGTVSGASWVVFPDEPGFDARLARAVVLVVTVEDIAVQEADFVDYETGEPTRRVNRIATARVDEVLHAEELSEAALDGEVAEPIGGQASIDVGDPIEINQQLEGAEPLPVSTNDLVLPEVGKRYLALSWGMGWAVGASDDPDRVRAILPMLGDGSTVLLEIMDGEVPVDAGPGPVVRLDAVRELAQDRREDRLDADGD